MSREHRSPGTPPSQSAGPAGPERGSASPSGPHRSTAPADGSAVRPDHDVTRADGQDVVLDLGPAPERADIHMLCARLEAMLRDTGVDVVLIDLRAVPRPDVVTVEALARLQLTAQRWGCRIRLANAPARMRELLFLTGLAAALEPPGGLLGQPRRQSEQREQPFRVEEGVDPGDPPG